MVSCHSLLEVPWCEERGVPGREDERSQWMKLPGSVSISPSKVRQGSCPHLTLSPPAPPGLWAFLENPAILPGYMDYSCNCKLTCTLKASEISFYSPLFLCLQEFRLPRSSSEHVCRVTLEGALIYHQLREGFIDLK